MTEYTYRDRADAGQRLAEALSEYKDTNSILMALPRGGVPVGFEIAQALGLPLNVMTVRKLGTPGHEEMAMGAIASGGVQVLNPSLIRSMRISRAQVEEVAEQEHHELRRREAMYREGSSPPDLEGRTVILVDDGLATGATMQAAVLAAQRHHPKQIIVAVPLASQQARDALRDEVDKIVCLQTPAQFQAVGLWYDDFGQTTDEQVQTLMQRAEREVGAS